MSTINEKAKVALLIDGDNNVSCENLPQIVGIAKNFGDVYDRRIYGHGNMLNKFSDVIVKYAIEPKYSLKPIPGKDTADHKLIIDAVDIVRDGIVDVVCIASSDSDFRDLGIYIKSKGKRAVAICSNTNATKYFGDAFEIHTLSSKADANVTEAKKSQDDDKAQIIFDVNSDEKSDTTAQNQENYTLDQIKLYVDGVYAEMVAKREKPLLDTVSKSVYKQFPGFKVKLLGYSKILTMVKAITDATIILNNFFIIFLL